MSTNKRYTVHDIGRALGLSAQTIRNYENFGKLPRPKKDENKWRYYTDEDLNKIKAYFFDYRKKEK